MNKYESINFKAPKKVRSRYKQGLKLHEQGKSGDGLELETVSQAKKIISGKPITPDWAKKGNRFWGRNERFLSESIDSPAYISALLWGGAPGKDWFKKLVRQISEIDKKAKSNMINTRISFFANVSKTQIEENDRDFILRGVPVTKDDAVMNGLLYSGEHNKKGIKSLLGKVVTLSHPTNRSGEGASAYEAYSLKKHFSGGEVINVYSNNGVWKVDIEIAKHILKAQDIANNSDFYERLENKLPIGVSTGLYTDVEEILGVNASGEKYQGIATNQQYDHLAMLPENEPPAGGNDTFMRFNSDEKIKKMVINLSDYLNDDTVNEEELSANIKELSEFMKSESFSNAIKNAVEYMPESTYKTKESECCEEKQEHNVLLKILQLLGLSKLFANKNQPNYNNYNDGLETNEDQNMADMKKMRATLQKAGKLKDEMSDEDIKNAYDKMVASEKKKAPESNGEIDLSKIEARLNSLEEENKLLKIEVNAKSESEKKQIINDLDLSDIGLDKEDLEAMEINALKKLHVKHCSVTNSLSTVMNYKHNADTFEEMPEMEVH